MAALRGSLSCLTDPDAVTALFVEVVQIGERRPYPSKQHSQYLVVRLRVLFTDRETHLILFDDQLRLAALLRTGMVLLLFRPYVVMNIDEPLFGPCNGCDTGGLMAHSVASEATTTTTTTAAEAAAAPDLAHASSHQPRTVFPVHLLYGTVTVMAEVSGIVETNDGSSTSSSSSITREQYLKDLVFSSQPFYTLIMSFL